MCMNPMPTTQQIPQRIASRGVGAMNTHTGVILQGEFDCAETALNRFSKVAPGPCEIEIFNSSGKTLLVVKGEISSQ